MSNLGAGNLVYDLRKKIQQLQSELNSIDSFDHSPEIIDSTNLLRTNEYLVKKIQKQDELIQVCMEHSKSLEQLLLTLFEIQLDLKDILKAQSSLLSKRKR